MNTSRIALNSLWLLLARMGAQGLALIFTALVARRMGEAGLGQYAFAAAVVYLGNALTTFGTDTLLIREVARTPSAATTLVPAALWLQLMLSALWIGGVLLLSARQPALGLYSLALIPWAFFTVCTALLRAGERMDLYLLANLAAALAQTVGALFLLTSRTSLLELCALLVAVQAFAALLAGALCAAHVPGFRLTLRVDSARLSGLARAALPFALLTVLGVLAQRLNIFVVSALMSDAATGWFAASARLVEGLKLGHLALLGALFPALSHAVGAGAGTVTHVRRALAQLVTLAIGLALGVSLFARPLVTLLYGPRFAPTVQALPIQVWALVPYSLTAVISLWFVARGAEGRAVFGTGLSLLLMLGGYVLLIHRLGWIGASWGMVVGESVQAGVFILMSLVPFSVRKPLDVAHAI